MFRAKVEQKITAPWPAIQSPFDVHIRPQTFFIFTASMTPPKLMNPFDDASKNCCSMSHDFQDVSPPKQQCAYCSSLTRFRGAIPYHRPYHRPYHTIPYHTIGHTIVIRTHDGPKKHVFLNVYTAYMWFPLLLCFLVILRKRECTRRCYQVPWYYLLALIINNLFGTP